MSGIYLPEPELRQKFLSLKVWKQKGQEAPNKPLLVLFALSRLRFGEPRLMAFADIVGPMDKLLRGSSTNTCSSHPEYAFWRLQNDAIWEVISKEPLIPRRGNTDPPRRELLSKEAVGGFTVQVYNSLRQDSENLTSTLARAVAERFLDPAMRQSVGAALHFDIS
jgi:putative restriction endonuclease